MTAVPSDLITGKHLNQMTGSAVSGFNSGTKFAKQKGKAPNDDRLKKEHTGRFEFRSQFASGLDSTVLQMLPLDYQLYLQQTLQASAQVVTAETGFNIQELATVALSLDQQLKAINYLVTSSNPAAAFHTSFLSEADVSALALEHASAQPLMYYRTKQLHDGGIMGASLDAEDSSRPRPSSLHALLLRGRRVQVDDGRQDERRLVAYLSSMREYIVANLQPESMPLALAPQSISGSALEDSHAILPDQSEFRQCLTLILENFLTLVRQSTQSAVLQALQ